MKKPTVIGTFSGKCADATVTNENGLDITRPVWETLFNSEIYKNALDLGHYIGYLGHPEDPSDMNFMNACIVMREGHIDDNGEVFGEFDLIDTPVGRIVKTFIDAGVSFGISVRGAGDIIDNSVDPETFVFRGFDLVTFPAYTDAIPEFTEIAASTNSDLQAKYKKICSSVALDLKNITSCEALNVIQSQFPEQSETYAELEDRKQELLNTITSEPSLEDEKLQGVMHLYLQEKARADKAEAVIEDLYAKQQSENIRSNKKLNAMLRIVADQEHHIDDVEGQYIQSCKELKQTVRKLTRENKAIKASNQSLKSDKKSLEAKLTVIEGSNQKLTDKLATITAANKHLKQEVETSNETNLQYNAKIKASDDKISKLQDELDKTVVEANQALEEASNLDAQVSELQKDILASQQLIEEYQDAYASLYSKAVGVNLSNVSVTASTSVADLQKRIVSSSAPITVSDEFAELQQTGEAWNSDLDDENYLVTL